MHVALGIMPTFPYPLHPIQYPASGVLPLPESTCVQEHHFDLDTVRIVRALSLPYKQHFIDVRQTDDVSAQSP